MRLTNTGFLILTTIFLVNARQFDEENEYATVEDDEDSHNDYREKRILWPYPLNKDSKVDKEPFNATYEYLKENNNKREKRYLGYYRQNPVVDMMMQSLPSQYRPNNPSDPFDILRDSYPLPKGNIIL